MKYVFIVLLATGLFLSQGLQAGYGESRDNESDEGYSYDVPGYGWGRHHMMGYGPCGPGMRGGDSGMYEGRGCRHTPRDWKSMTPEEQKKWEEIRAAHQMETLELRKQLVSKKLEIETLWDQPKVDHARIEKLSDEVAQIEAELAKKRDRHLLECRKQFGDKGWACPGSW